MPAPVQADAGAGAPRPTVALVVYGYPFDKSPSLQNLVRDLARGETVAVWVDHRHAGRVPEDIAPLLHTPGPPPPRTAGGSYERGAVETFIRNSLPRPLRRVFRELYVAREVFAPLPRFCRYLRRQGRAPVLIAADKTSLLAALLCGRVPRLYYSLEATPLRDEDSLVYMMLNAIESIYVRIARPWVVAQSRARADLVQRVRGRQLIVPVTSDGDALPKSPWLRERLGIAPGQRILLIAGGLGADQMTQEIVESTARWDPRFVLVLHSASGRFTPELLARVRAPDLAGRVLLSQDHFTIEEAEQRVYAGADVGIVYYRDVGFNHRHTAYSSGKLAAFLRAGVPVVVPDFEEFRSAVAELRFGACAGVDDIGRAAGRIVDDHAAYVQAAYAAYDKVYRYANYRGRVGAVVAALRQEHAA